MFLYYSLIFLKIYTLYKNFFQDIFILFKFSPGCTRSCKKILIKINFLIFKSLSTIFLIFSKFHQVSIYSTEFACSLQSPLACFTHVIHSRKGLPMSKKWILSFPQNWVVGTHINRFEEYKAYCSIEPEI